MMGSLLRARDFYAGLLVLAIGLAVIAGAIAYSIGTLFDMGPGYFPLLVGSATAASGLLLIASAVVGVRRGGTIRAEGGGRHLPDLRGGACIVAAILAFVVMLPLGFVPAAFVCVFVAAMGDRGMRVGVALILSAVVTVVSVLLFSYGLQLQLPLFGS